MSQVQEINNFINGCYVPASGGDTLPVFDPSKGSIFAKVANSTIQDLEQAVEAAQKAFEAWSGAPADERAEVLNKLAQLIDEHAQELAEAESLDNGKPLSLAKQVDIPRASANMRFFAHAATQFASESHRMADAINYTIRSPLGVVATISPWNLPLYLFTWKIAPALAAGNCVIAKPSEVTPLTASLLAGMCNDAGMPPGVLNVIHGEGHNIGAELVRHKSIKAISFTGSTRVGQEIATSVAPMFKKTSLEMGGKNPNLIFADCNYQQMLDTTLRSSFANQGQICLCGSRIYIEESIYDQFKHDFVKATEQLVTGPPGDQSSDLGAVVSSQHFQKIMGHIEDAQKEGGRILTGGSALKPTGHENGWYIKPTIIEGLSNNCKTNQEEIFGPVVTIQPFKDESEVVKFANSSDYGLAATIWTENLSRAHRLAAAIDCGIIWINTWLHRDLRTPFGGMKMSGIGREGGLEAMRFFTEPKNVCIKH